MRRWLAALLSLAACGHRRTVDPTRADELFDRVTIDTGGVHGLSGLAADDRDGLWMVAERGKALFRVTLDGAKVTTTTRLPVDIADGRDLESLAWIDGELYAGLETKGDTVHVVALRRVAGEGFRADDFADITSAEAGTPIGDNHGVEGLCAAGGVLVAAIEAAATDTRGRWAPLVVIDRADPARRTVRRLRLTSATGKISGLDCRTNAAGTLDMLAIERHFEVTRVLTFTLDPAAATDGAADIVPRLSIDLGPALRGALNLEGIVWGPAPARHPIAVVDNQYGRITGPDELLRFKVPAP